MIGLTLKDIAVICGTEYHGTNRVISGISTDSRKILPGELFAAVRGQRFDGHDFCGDAIKNGACCVLCEEISGNFPAVKVDSVIQALHKIAAYIRKQVNPFIAAVTGSCGKTTTKELIASVFQTCRKTRKTLGNFNNELGVPLSIFKMEMQDEVYVCELGMNHTGEIAAMIDTVMPDIVLITNVFEAHIGNFKNIDEIVCAKLEIASSEQPPKKILINGDIPVLKKYAQNLSNVEFFGYGSDCSWQIRKTGNECFQLVYNAQVFDFAIHSPFEAMIVNSAAAAACGFLSGLSYEQIKKGLLDFRHVSSRMQIERGKILIVNDCYNANPGSMKSVISDFPKVSEGYEPVLVLGSMLELGEFSERLHCELADSIIPVKPAYVHLVGDDIFPLAAVLKKNNIQCFWHKDSEECAEVLKSRAKEGQGFLIKGSNSIKMQKIVEKLAWLI